MSTTDVETKLRRFIEEEILEEESPGMRKQLLPAEPGPASTQTEGVAVRAEPQEEIEDRRQTGADPEPPRRAGHAALTVP